MSSDKFIKMRIKQMILNERIATYGRGDGSMGAEFSSMWSAPGLEQEPFGYGPGSDPMYTRSTSYADTIKNVVGFFAPLAITATKTLTDLGRSAMSLGQSIFAGVGSIFSGQSPAYRWSEIAANQRAAFARSDLKATQRIRSWGLRDGPGANISFLNELYENSETGQVDQLDQDTEILSSVEADLERFFREVDEVLSEMSIDGVVSSGSAVLHVSPERFSSNSFVAEDLDDETRQEAEQRLVPFIKSAFLSDAIAALEITRQNVFEEYRSLDFSMDSVTEGQIRAAYESAISRLQSLKSSQA